MAELPRSHPITGADYFVWALDRQMRRAGVSGNVCRLVVRLEGGPDPARLAERLSRSPVARWLSRLRLARPLRLLSPRWTEVAGPPPGLLAVSLETGARNGGALPAELPERDLRADRSPCLAVDLLRGAGDVGHLVLTWHHALMDVRGAELFVRHLGADPSGDREAAVSAFAASGACPGLLERLRGTPRRLAFARESLAFITSACREPMVSLVGEAALPGPCRYRVHWFDAEQTARVDAHGLRLEAGFRRSLFYLAASVRALHAVAERRGETGGAYVVPVPHDLRRRGAEGPLLSNQLSFLFFRVEAAEAGDLRAVIGGLTSQMLEQVRARSTESFLASMELFRPFPLDFYVRQLGRPTGGRVATFFFSDAGESCPGLTELAGARPTAVTHLAPAARPPGLTVVTSRFRGRLCFVLSWAEDCLSAEEVDHLEAGLAAALLGEEGP